MPSILRRISDLDLTGHTSKILFVALCVASALGITSGVFHQRYALPTNVMPVVLTITTGIATLYDSKTFTQKIMKLLIVILLGFFQTMSIIKQSRKAETASKEEKQHQADAFVKEAVDRERNFQQLFQKQQDQLSESQREATKQGKRFTQTVDKLDQALATERLTLDQATPRPDLRLRSYSTKGARIFDRTERSVTVSFQNIGNDAARNISIFVDSFTGNGNLKALGTLATSLFEADWRQVQYDNSASRYSQKHTIDRIESLRPAETVVSTATITQEQDRWEQFRVAARQDCLANAAESDEVERKRKQADEPACRARNARLGGDREVCFGDFDVPDPRDECKIPPYAEGDMNLKARDVMSYIRVTYTDQRGNWALDFCRLGAVKSEGVYEITAAEPCYGWSDFGIHSLPRRIVVDPKKQAGLPFHLGSESH